MDHTGTALRWWSLVAAACLCTTCSSVSYLPSAAASASVPHYQRPVSIAHRGASGVLPEHTLQGYQRAIEQGADFIECDVVLTKDCALICRHEPDLSNTTDAIQKFGHLQRTYVLPAHGELQARAQGVWSVDLTLAEVQQLRAMQARPYRDQQFNGQFQVPTLQQYIETALAAPHPVGIYVEIKHPSWHDSLGQQCMQGKAITQLTLQVIEQYGYGGNMQSERWQKQPAFIQSFEVSNLRWLHTVTDLPLVQLIDDLSLQVADTNQTFAELVTDAALDDIASYAAAIGPWKSSLVPNYLSTGPALTSTNLVQRAHDRGLLVHPFTFRDEPRFLAAQWQNNSLLEYQHFVEEVGVDGIFTDFPASLQTYFTTMRNQSPVGERGVAGSAAGAWAKSLVHDSNRSAKAPMMAIWQGNLLPTIHLRFQQNVTRISQAYLQSTVQWSLRRLSLSM